MIENRSAVLAATVALIVSCSGSNASPDAGTGGGTNASGGGTHASGGGTNASGGGTNASGGGTHASGGGTNASGGGSSTPDAGSPIDAGVLIYFENFDTGPLPSRFGAQAGGTVALSTDTTKNYASSPGSVRGTYPAPGAGGIFVYGGYDLSTYSTEEVFIEFRAKMPATTFGLKFCKVFGMRSGSGMNTYANTTFGLDYTGIDNGSMQYIGFGDGTGLANDTANGVWLDGTTGTKVGRSLGAAVLDTPQNMAWASSRWGTDWHLFRLHVKFNSGTTSQNEVADGAVDVIIDGVTWVHATHLFNRNSADGPIDNVELFDWSQSGSAPFEVWYDDVKISLGNWVD